MNTRQLIVRVIISFVYLLLAVGMYRKQAYLSLALWTCALTLLLAREDEAILNRVKPRHRRFAAAALAAASVLVLIFTQH